MTVVDYQGSIFGRIVSGWDVEEWVLALLRTWTGTYLSEVERQHGIVAGTLARPRAYVRTISFDKWPEDQLPAVLVLSTGIIGPPKTNGETMRASWAVGIGVVCSARTQDESNRNARLLVAALRTLFKQRPSLDGNAEGVTWATEDYDDLAYDDTRSLTGGRVTLAVEVDDVVSVNAGPATPDAPLDPDTLPWPDWQEVEEVDVDVERDPAYQLAHRGELPHEGGGMRPGVDVISRALPAPVSAPTDIGVAFVIGATEQGPTYALVHSLAEYEYVFGTRGAVAGPQATYDAADVYFREGGGKLYVASTSPTGGSTLSAEPEAEPAKGKAAAAPRLLDVAVQAALDALTKDLGPGQVFIADPALAADPANQSALLAHAAATNRVVLLSCADGDAATITAAATALNLDANARYGALFAPSAVVPGIAAGTTRTVPYPAVEAGIIARNDAGYSPNIAAAGDAGISLYALDVNGRYSDGDYQALNDAGADMARVIFGSVETYGYRTVVDATDPQAALWLNFGNARLNMAIAAEAEAIGERYVFQQLDGRGLTIAEFGADLSAMLATFYDEGSLYGATAAEAYQVDVGSQVNTPQTIANGELHAILSVKMAPFTEWVVIEIVKVSTTQALAA